MKIGTKSVLFGAHCFLIHPWFVVAAWWKLYGFPWDPRLWIAFFVHDLGYIGKPNMDGPEGETHVELGARIMGWLFDRGEIYINIQTDLYAYDNGPRRIFHLSGFTLIKGTKRKWEDLARYHSRYYAKKDARQPSRLCMADKLAISLEPAWLYLPRVNWSGEIHEYMKHAEIGKYKSMNLPIGSQKAWFLAMTFYLKCYANEHKDGKVDTWTPKEKRAINAEGVTK